MKTKIRSRLDHYTVHCPRCGNVSHGSEVRGARPESTIETAGLQPSPESYPSWVTDLEIDREFENEIH